MNLPFPWPKRGVKGHWKGNLRRNQSFCPFRGLKGVQKGTGRAAAKQLPVCRISKGDRSPACEPTDYRVLEALADSGYITAESYVIDYGCGLGRSVLFLSARTGCRATGIEFDRQLYEGAVKNLEQSKLPTSYKKGIRFVCADARKYQIQDEDCFYFFNPFADEVLQVVLGRIRQSYYEEPRQMYLFFYYPFDGEVAALMTEDGLQFVDEIDCTGLYEAYDKHERILIFEVI